MEGCVTHRLHQLNRLINEGRILCGLLRCISAHIWKTFTEGVLGILPIRLHHYTEHYLEKVYKNSATLKNNQVYQSRLESISYFIASSLFMVSIGVMLILSSVFVIKGKVSMGGLTAILMYNHMLTDPLLKVLDINQKIIKLNVSLKRIMEISALPKDEKLMEYGSVDELEMKHVNFSIENQNVLKDINLCFKTPTSIAIFGSTGSGKTTLVNLIGGIYSPTSG